MAHGGPWGRTGSRLSPRLAPAATCGYVDECWGYLSLFGAFSVSFFCCVSVFAPLPSSGHPSEAVSGAPHLPLSGPPSHFLANRESPLPSLWLNLLLALSYSGSVLPALPLLLLLLLLPAGEGQVKGSLLGQEKGSKGLDFGLPTSSYLAAAKHNS